MSTFTPTRKGNPCQICGDTTAKCRETEGNVLLCMTFSEAIGTPNIPGFKFIGRSKDDLWGKWIVDDGQSWTEQQRGYWKRTQAAQRQLRIAARRERQAQSLSATERDRYYQKLLSQLTLSPADRKDLERRGLTAEEIEAGGFKSVEQWQQLRNPVSNLLPGVNLDGITLNTQAGYLCPIRDVDGLIVSCQVRLRQSEDGRYRWLSSATKKRPDGPSPHLQNGELPIAVHRPPAPKGASIGMTEGVGAKPFIAARRMNQIVVGAAGGLFASSPQLLRASLEQLASELETRTIDFYPDAGSPLNRGVTRQYEAVWNLLEEWGFDVRINWWGQFTKEQPDIDELQNPGLIKFLTPGQFLKDAEREVWRRHYAEKQRQTARHTFTHEPDLLVSERYLPEVRLCDVRRGTTALKAGCGGGKSSNVLAPVSRGALDKGLDVIQVGHLNSLLENTAPKLNLDTHKTVKDLASAARGIVNLSTHPNLSTTLHTLGEMIDVSRRDRPFVLILDEVEQILQSLTDRTNDTLKGTLRLAVRQKLEYLVRHADYAFLSDADLSDIVLNYISRLRGGEKPYVIQSIFKIGEGRLPIKVNTAKDSSSTIEEILECLRNGEKAIIFCDSRKDAEALIKTIEADPDLSRLNGRAVHGKVTGEPDVEKFIANIDKEYPELDYLIHTSSLGTGVDLSRKHFTRRFLLVGGGVLAATQICQSFHRDRNDIPTEIWIKPNAGTRECDPGKILQALMYRESCTFDMLRCAEIGVRVDAVGKVDPDDEAFLELYAQLTARKNASLNNLVASVCEELEASGYTLELDQTAINEDIKAEFKECKQEIQQAEYEAIASSPMLSDEELAAKSKSATLSLLDRYAVHKTLLHRETGLEVTPELLKLDSEGRWRKGVKHLEHLLSEPTVSLLDDALDRERNPVPSDRSHYTMKRNLLADLGINEFLKPGMEWRKSDPLLTQFSERCRLRAYDIKIICGFKIPRDPDKLSDVQILGEFLRRLGLATVSRQTGAGNQRERLYQIDPERMRLCEQVIEHRRKRRRQEHTPSLNFVSGETSARAHPPSALPSEPTQEIETHPPLYIYSSPRGVSNSAPSESGSSPIGTNVEPPLSATTVGDGTEAEAPHQPVSPPVEPLPTPPISVGSMVTRVGSIGRWVVEAIAGQTAKVKQLGGWGFGDFPISELEPLGAV